MIEQSENTEAAALILQDFELAEPAHPLSEAEILSYLSDAIAYMIEHKLDFLLSLLYRLDVDEQKISNALLPGNPEPANQALARLVWERQKQRVKTKLIYRQQNPRSWNWDTE